jgi:hypothetical protein
MKIICEYIWPLYGKDGHEINQPGKERSTNVILNFIFLKIVFKLLMKLIYG